jgi:HPt (histidine-containing phosphotransfer) domain-containing protein
MNLQALTRPQIPDREGLGDFAEALKDHALALENSINRLRRSPGDEDTVAELFRAVHNIKGDAALCQVETGVALAHPVENLLSRLRSGEVRLSDALAETILLTVDRLELATTALLQRGSIAHLHLVELAGGLERLAGLSGKALEDGCTDVIEAVTGFRPARLPAQVRQASVRRSELDARSSDLGLFRRLAQQLDARSALLKGRSGRLLRLALDTNELAGTPIDPAQLEAAALFHDMGMMFLADEAWLKTGALSEAERKALHEHPVYGAELLARIPGWTEASLIVRQHHEMPDGNGYPGGLPGSEICPGAKLLAIVDAFEAVMLKQSHRGRSLLRAVAEINASPNQFAEEWMAPFNQVIRRILERA